MGSTARRLESEARILQELSRVGVWSFDLHRRRFQWSEAMWHLHGLAPRKGSLGLDVVRSFVHPDDRRGFGGRLEAIEAEGPMESRRGMDARGTFGMDYRTTRGAVLHARARLETDGRGKPRRIVGTSQDVTDERRREGPRLWAFLAQVIEESADAVLTTDPDSLVTGWNPAAAALLGYAAEDVRGRPCAMFCPPELEGQGKDLASRIARGERVPPFETKRMHADGRSVDVSLAISPLRDPEGNVVGAVQVLRDLRPHKEARAREYAAMDAEIRRLDDMQRFRARFLNVAAHELKTPLTPIRLQLQLLSMQLQDQPEAMRKSLAILTRSVERLRLLVDDVLDAARVQALQLRLRKEPLDLGEVLLEALETYAPVAKEGGVRLELEVPAPVQVLGDSTRFLQVANNLLSNAIKFTPSGGHVRVSLRKEGPDAVLSVEDSGRGLSGEQQSQLFQPFTQVHSDLESTSKGSGLGLFIVKAIVEQHGGRIRVGSPGPGRGTTVTVHVPLLQSQDSPGAQAPGSQGLLSSGSQGPQSSESRTRQVPGSLG